MVGPSAGKSAQNAEKEIQRGKWRGQLHGIPLALKDLFDTAGVRTTAASAVFKDRVPEEDAEVVRRLKTAGAVLLGKLNMHEFAYGGTSIISYFGPVHNPWGPTYSPGGSSGGSAAAVAAGLCFGALGSDTGGSINVLEPLLKEIESLNERIKKYDGRMEKIAKEVYPEVSLLKQVKGVGTQIALTLCPDDRGPVSVCEESRGRLFSGITTWPQELRGERTTEGHQ